MFTLKTFHPPPFRLRHRRSLVCFTHPPQLYIGHFDTLVRKKLIEMDRIRKKFGSLNGFAWSIDWNIIESYCFSHVPLKYAAPISPRESYVLSLSNCVQRDTPAAG